MDFLQLAKSVIRQGNTRRKRWNRKNLNISWSVPGWHHRPSTTSLGASSWSRAMKPEKPYSSAIRANGLHKPRSTLSPMQNFRGMGAGMRCQKPCRHRYGHRRGAHLSGSHRTGIGQLLGLQFRRVATQRQPPIVL